jgi:hypothetical protein
VSLVLPVVLLLAEAVLLFFLPASPRWLLAQQTPASTFSTQAVTSVNVLFGREVENLPRF